MPKTITCISFDVSSCPPGVWESSPRLLSKEFLLCDEPSEETRSPVCDVDLWAVKFEFPLSFSLLITRYWTEINNIRKYKKKICINIKLTPPFLESANMTGGVLHWLCCPVKHCLIQPGIRWPFGPIIHASYNRIKKQIMQQY